MTDKLNIVLVHGAFADGSHWRHIIPRLYRAGHRVMAAQNPLTSLADDIANTRKLAEWMGGPTLLVGHSYGGAVITGAGRATNVVGLVYLAAFAPAQGESLNSILARSDPTPGLASISPAFDDDFLMAPPGHVPRQLLSGPRRHRVAGHGNNPKATRTSLLRRCYRGASVEHQAKLVSGLGPRANDRAADPAVDG
jgi:pimeloyl-ACP methyl ester carboxylesterase